MTKQLSASASVAALAEIDSLKKTIEFQTTIIAGNDAAIKQLTKRADDNYESGEAWKKHATGLQSKIDKSRDEFSELKEHTHRLELQLSRLEGYRDHVREVADSQRTPVTTTITEPSTAPRMQRNEAMRGSRTDVATNWPARHMAMGAEREPRDWVNY